MQLLSVHSARSVWLIQVKDLNPRGKDLDAKLIEWLKTTYHFQQYPSYPIAADAQAKGLVFSNGRFQRGTEEDGSEKYIWVDLTIFNDGLVATTRSSTNDTDDFLSEVLILAAGEFHLVYHSEMIRKRLYLSELNIKLDNSLKLLNPSLEQFAARISSLQANSPPIAYEVSSIGFWPDPAIQQWRPSPFRLERKVDTAWSENRYFSAAPLHTEDHIKLLEDFEQLLKA